jgi:hypothetical protein
MSAGGGGVDSRYLAFQERKAQEQAAAQAAAQQQAAQIAAINAQALAQQQAYYQEVAIAQQRAGQEQQAAQFAAQSAAQARAQAEAARLQREQMAELKRGSQPAKPVDPGAILAREKQRGKAGASGTLLTGPAGIATDQLPLGRRTLLGG